MELYRLYKAAEEGTIKMRGHGFSFEKIRDQVYSQLASTIANDLDRLWADDWVSSLPPESQKPTSPDQAPKLKKKVKPWSSRSSPSGIRFNGRGLGEGTALSGTIETPRLW